MGEEEEERVAEGKAEREGITVYTNKRRKCLIKFRDTFGMLHWSGPVVPQSGIGKGTRCGHWVGSTEMMLVRGVRNSLACLSSSCQTN